MNSYKLKGILPAVRNMKDFDLVLKSEHEIIVLLETRLSQVTSLVKHAKDNDKKVLIHLDLVQGLKTDSFGFEFLLRNVKPDGVISTRGNMISLAKKNKLIAIQRLFALDSHALKRNIDIIENSKPNYVEVLPGVVPYIIHEIGDKTDIPVIAGGLIRTKEEIKKAYKGGAIAVTTSNTELWGTYERFK
ncbi:glycerol-3-phosphate responsive antiterminator [Virgibacillus sp. C22-A2]|uniref:Glycerol uptake operon antiterminator regulatory protein n=1 Tax=Virgibacillus tibetensis TaxID=3042313 RepID=A0ABU6KCI3_9BACI|nr:glycerol-3-phosphate responsive antiterminator [Virgibacillus sp. C22-A2]